MENRAFGMDSQGSWCRRETPEVNETVIYASVSARLHSRDIFILAFFLIYHASPWQPLMHSRKSNIIFPIFTRAEAPGLLPDQIKELGEGMFLLPRCYRADQMVPGFANLK